MRNKDVLVAARPDQSLQIYRSLLIDRISFDFITFKVVPHWVKRFICSNRVVGVGKGSYIALWGTFKHLFIRKFKFKFAKNWDDHCILNRIVMRLLKCNSYKVVHFWPDNCSVNDKVYKAYNNDCFVIADIHMAHPQVVYDEMAAIYNMYGIPPESTALYGKIQDQKGYVEMAENVLVPSSYVAETYRIYYPNKNYYIVPYGIPIFPTYEIRHREEIKEFVYIGVISLEKGCDLLLEYFYNHSNINIHLFGTILDEQKFVFDKYKNIPNIFFHGHVPKQILKDYIMNYDVGIHLSRFDAYSLAVGEMIASGLPVIVSDKTGNADDIQKFGLGLVTHLDMKSIDDAVRFILDVDIYNSYQEKLKTYINNETGDYGKMMLKFYKDIIDGNADAYKVK